jgi:hypothetical protein
MPESWQKIENMYISTILFNYLQSCLKTGFQDFSRYLHHTKTGKICQMTTKYTKCPWNISNGHYVYIPTLSVPRPSKLYQNWDFGNESIPSGNPVYKVRAPIYVCDRWSSKDWNVSKRSFKVLDNQLWAYFFLCDYISIRYLSTANEQKIELSCFVWQPLENSFGVDSIHFLHVSANTYVHSNKRQLDYFARRNWGQCKYICFHASEMFVVAKFSGTR